jgi:hypothetical protein
MFLFEVTIVVSFYCWFSLSYYSIYRHCFLKINCMFRDNVYASTNTCFIMLEMKKNKPKEPIMTHSP